VIRLSLVVAATAALTLSACSSSDTPQPLPTESTATTIEVRATDSECTLSANSSEPGPLTFAVRNDAALPLTFTLFESDGKTALGEVSAIEPGLTNDLSINGIEGAYIAACLPEGETEPLRVAFTVL
jgi:iron uptake system component EfeO